MISPALAGTLVQLGVSTGVGAGVLLLGGMEMAYSFALGALIFIVPNAYFTAYAFRYRGARQASRVAQSFSWGELGKFALVAVGFGLVFRFVSPLNHLLLFAGFVFLTVLQWWLAVVLQKYWLMKISGRG